MCHPITWFTALIVGVALILIVVPGDPCHPSYDDPSWWNGQRIKTREEAWELYRRTMNAEGLGFPKFQPALYEHGWPLPAFVRASRFPSVFISPSYPVRTAPRWSMSSRWPFTFDTWRLHGVNLLIDGLVCFVVVFGCAALVETWLHRRGGLFRFRLIDLFAVVSIACCVLAWWQFHVGVAREEARVGQLLFEGGTASRPRYRGHTEYTGPEWLRRLVGNENYLPALNHVANVRLYGSHSADSYEQLANLPYVRHISIASPLPNSAIPALKKAGTIRSFSYSMYSPPGKSLPGASIQRWLDADLTPELIGPSELDQLAELELHELALDGYMLIFEDIARALTANQQLERLTLREASISIDEFNELQRRFSKVRFEWSPASNQLPENSESKAYRRRAEMMQELRALRRPAPGLL